MSHTNISAIHKDIKKISKLKIQRLIQIDWTKPTTRAKKMVERVGEDAKIGFPEHPSMFLLIINWPKCERFWDRYLT